MKIGNLDLGKEPLLLAPMEDVTDVAFRMMCKRFGADMVYTEFVSSDALIRHVNKTKQKLHILDEERPVAIQIYGRDPVAMAEAAAICEEAKPDLIDINFGCPVKKVAGKGAGAGLLKDVSKMLVITRSVVNAVKIPVTAKTRLGWDADSCIIVDLAESLQDCGIAALTIHGRTRAQMYTGEADWSFIGEVKRNPRVHIPIIGNGDITSPELCRRRFDETGVDAVMIGRGSIGRPWIFGEIKHYLSFGVSVEQNSANTNENISQTPYSLKWKVEILKEQITESVRRLDERRGIIHIRRHLAATPVFKGIPNFRETRIAMLRAENVTELFSIIDSISFE